MNHIIFMEELKAVPTGNACLFLLYVEVTNIIYRAVDVCQSFTAERWIKLVDHRLVANIEARAKASE